MKPLTPPIDYTNLDYTALRQSMLELAQESLPEWTDFSENDLGVLLVELFAYACDLTLYYQSRIANNLFPETSDEPEALIQLLRLIGYELNPPAPATTDLAIAFDTSVTPPINLPSGTQFTVSLASGEELIFETEATIEIQSTQLGQPDAQSLRWFLPVPVVQGQTATDNPIAISDGSPNQLYALQQAPVISGSIRVIVTEPGGETIWQAVPTLANSSPVDRHFIVQRDAKGGAIVRFGDGQNGMIPPKGTAVNPVFIRATYRVGGGAQANVPANTDFSLTSTLPNNISILMARNLQAAAGGSSGEDLNRARLLAPRLFRSQERAVTTQDYADLALQVPGVGKAIALAQNWNQVVLYIAPTGKVTAPSELLKRDLLTFFESRRMATTLVEIVGSRPADIYIRVEVQAQPFFRRSDARLAVEQAIKQFLAFDAIEFGQPIYLSRLYDRLQDLPQVISVFVREFSSQPNSFQVAPEGTIVLQSNELPRLGYQDNPETPPLLSDPILIRGGQP